MRRVGIEGGAKRCPGLSVLQVKNDVGCPCAAGGSGLTVDGLAALPDAMPGLTSLPGGV